MGQILSQDEVDALLSAVNVSGGPDKKGEREIRPYDLANQDRVVHGKMPVMEIIYERFTRLFRVSLSNSLRKIATVSMVSTDLLRFGELINTLPIPSCICVMRFNTLRGPAIMVFEPKLAYSIIDSYFGGTDRVFLKIVGKEFTMIELSFMKKVMEMAINNLEEAWKPIHPLDAQYVRTEINPQFVGIAPPSEIMITTTFEVEFKSASGAIIIVIPYSTIEPIKQKLSSSIQTDNDADNFVWKQVMHNNIKEVSSNVIVNMGMAEMTIGHLLNLKKGDIIPLDMQSDGEASVVVEDVEKMKCIIGTHKGNKAVQITNIVDK